MSQRDRCARRGALLAITITLAASGVPAPGFGWHTAGHARVARAAVELLPGDVPAFFRDGAAAIAGATGDPDLMKDEAAMDRLEAFEEPEHYVDFERLYGVELPPNRYGLVPILAERRFTVEQIGFLPYTVSEGVERLTVAFAEHRRWPDDRLVQQKVLVYAGLLAHYAGDLQQPLHTSIHHDGRANPDGSAPFTGIHTLVDSFFERIPVDFTAATRGYTVRDLGDPWTAVRERLAASHALVDRVYELEAELRSGDATRQYSPAIVAFASDRFRASAGTTADLFYTAWQRSATHAIPTWHTREAVPPVEGVEIILRPRSPG